MAALCVHSLCSYVCKATVKTTSLEIPEVLSLKIKELLNDTYKEGPFSLYVKPEDVAVKSIGKTSLKPHWKLHTLQFCLSVIFVKFIFCEEVRLDNIRTSNQTDLMWWTICRRSCSDSDITNVGSGWMETSSNMNPRAQAGLNIFATKAEYSWCSYKSRSSRWWQAPQGDWNQTTEPNLPASIFSMPLHIGTILRWQISILLVWLLSLFFLKKQE